MKRWTNLSELTEDINRVVIGHTEPRRQVYIMARLFEAENLAAELLEQLAFERKVNDKVNEIFKGWFHREG